MWTIDRISLLLKCVNEFVEISWVVPCTVDDQDGRLALRHDEFVMEKEESSCNDLISEPSWRFAICNQVSRTLVA